MSTPTRVLIVDDDLDALRLVGILLERRGFVILAAASGQQAIDKAMEGQPDLVILDVMMPDMDGYQVAAQLRRHPATEDIPIMMFTAKTAVNDRVAGLQAGADDYLTKPVQPAELIARVEALLQKRKRTNEQTTRSSIISVLPTKGGLGTTSLTLNTALELKRMHTAKQIALVELQEGGGTAALQLGLRPLGGLPELLGVPLPQVTRDSLMHQMVRSESDIQLLLGSSMPSGMTHKIGRDLVRTILRYVGGDFDYVLVDLPASLGSGYAEALRMSGVVILTLEPNRIGLDLAQGTVKGLASLGISSQKTKAVLLHRNSASALFSRNTVEDALQCEVIGSIPSVPDLAYESVQSKQPMVLLQPQSLFAQHVRQIVQFIAQG